MRALPFGHCTRALVMLPCCIGAQWLRDRESESARERERERETGYLLITPKHWRFQPCGSVGSYLKSSRPLSYDCNLQCKLSGNQMLKRLFSGVRTQQCGK